MRPIHRIHSILGINLALLLVILGISGAVATFRFELEEHAENRLTEARNLSVNEAFEKLVSVSPELSAIRRLELPTNASGYRLRLNTGERFYLDTQGQANAVPAAHGIGDFLVNFHTRLFMGHAGRWFIGVLGLLLTLSLISGVLIHRRFIRDFFRLRVNRSARLAQSDTHKIFASWMLPLHLIIIVTGAWLGVHDLIAPPQKVELNFPVSIQTSNTPLNLSTLIERTRSTITHFQPVFIDFRDLGSERATIAVHGNIVGSLVRRHESGAIYHAPSGHRLHLIDPQNVSTTERIDLAFAPLHFGDFARIWLKVVYAIGGVALAGIAFTGILMWANRKPKHGVSPAKRRHIANWFIACSSGCAVASLGLPLLAYFSSTHSLAWFDGSFRLLALASSEAALAFVFFCIIWLLVALLTVIFLSRTYPLEQQNSP